MLLVVASESRWLWKLPKALPNAMALAIGPPCRSMPYAAIVALQYCTHWWYVEQSTAKQSHAS